MTTALFGVIGVIVGAVAAAASTFFIQRRDERLRQHAGTRLLCTDLHKVLALIEDVRRSGNWGAERSEIPTGAYDAHAFLLALSLPTKEWKLVEGAVLGVQHLELIRKSCIQEDRDLSPHEVAVFRRVGSFIDRALVELDHEGWAIDGSENDDRNTMTRKS